MLGMIVHESRFSYVCGKGNMSAIILLFLILLSGCTWNHNLTVITKLDGLPLADELERWK